MITKIIIWCLLGLIAEFLIFRLYSRQLRRNGWPPDTRRQRTNDVLIFTPICLAAGPFVFMIVFCILINNINEKH